MEKKRRTLGETFTEDQLKARAKEPAQVLAQLAVPIFVHLRETDPSLLESDNLDLAERAVSIAERIQEASLEHAIAKLAAQPNLADHGPSSNPDDYANSRR